VPRPLGVSLVKRRELLSIAFGGAVFASPFAARAQQNAMPVIGWLGDLAPDTATLAVSMFRQGIAEFGYDEGRNVAIEYRWAEGRFDRLPALAAELVERKVNVIATFVGTPAAAAAKTATSTIPIVFSVGVDPVAVGLVASLARPGGNLTGVTNFGTALLPKRLELLSELVPPNSAIAMLVNPNNPAAPGVSAPVEELARAKGLQFHLLNAGSETEIETAFEMLAQLRVGGLVITPDPMFNSRDSQLVALAARYAVPTIYYRREFVEGGGLISFGPSFAASFRQVGVYAGRILKGAKSADLPVHQPTKFELVINLKTAKALRLAVPESLWARADEVIE